jgi:hypothetical protein
MPRRDGTGPQGLGPGTGQGKGRGESGIKSPFQKSTLGGTLFAFASLLLGNWLDKRLAQNKAKDRSRLDESNQNASDLNDS